MAPTAWRATRAATLLSVVAWLSCALPPDPAPPPRPVSVAIPTGPATLVPDSEFEEHAIAVLGNVYETLVQLEPGPQMRPQLLEAWQNPDELTWVLSVRPGVRFHDGRALTAEIVADNLRRAWLEASHPDALTVDAVLPVEQVSARGVRTVVVRTAQPIPLLRSLARIHIWLPAQRADQAPVGTGPYRPVRFVAGEGIDLEAFAGHWDVAPRVDRLRFRFVSSAEERWAALREGRVDMVVDPPESRLREVEGSPGLRLLANPGLRVVFLGMRCAESAGRANPLARAEVRRALAHAVDRQALIAGVLRGRASIVDQLAVPGVVGHHRSLEPLPFDRNEARRLLAAAGLSEGFSVSLDYPRDKYRSMDAVAASLATDLKQVGIEVRPRPASFADLRERLYAGDTNLFLLGWMVTFDAGNAYRSLVHSRVAALSWGAALGYTNPRLDQLLEQELWTFGANHRSELMDEATEVLHDALPFFTLYRQDDLYVMNAELSFEPQQHRRLFGGSFRWREATPAPDS